MRLNPTSVNTIRVITVLQDDRVHVIGTILRMGVGSVVDNLSAGGIAAAVDPKSGHVTAPAVSIMPNENKYERHPVTKTEIIGFQIPEWSDVISLVETAATRVPSVRTVGWDVAIARTGPVLIEGNDNWNKRIWQVTLGKGMRSVLEAFTT